jgi:hypothetical protein
MTFEAYPADTAYDPEGGNCLHEAWVKNGRVFLSNNDDSYYQQDFKSREALQAFVTHLWNVADEAWPAPTSSISFNIQSLKEIAKFTDKGFYYKGEFIEDAGEVYRLLKEVLGQMKAEQSQ